MRALVVEAETLYALRMVDMLTSAGIRVIGPARSSGEALMLALREQPEIAVFRADLESVGAGHRLAQKLNSDLKVRCVIASEDDLRHAGQLSISTACDQISSIARAAKNI